MSILDNAYNDDDRILEAVTKIIINCAVAFQDQSAYIQEKLSIGCKDADRLRLNIIQELRRIARIGEENAKFAWKLITQCLEDSDADIRHEAAYELLQVAQAASINEATVFELLTIRFTEDDDPEVRLCIIGNISSIIKKETSSSEDAMKVLEQACYDRYVDVRIVAYGSIADLGRDLPVMTATAVKILKKSFEDEDEVARRRAIRLLLDLLHLKDIEEDTSGILSLLSQDPDPEIREDTDRFRRQLAMTEVERRADFYKWLLERWIWDYDYDAKGILTAIEGGVSNVDEVIIEVVRSALENSNEEIARGRMHDLPGIAVERILSGEMIPSCAAAVIQLLFGKYQATFSMEAKFHNMPLQLLLEYAFSSPDDKNFVEFMKEDPRRFSIAATVTSTRPSQESKLVIHEASKEVQFKRSPEEVQHLVSVLKSALPKTLHSFY